ncbi:helix-turn-helix transcriptional regulator [Pedobacter puniceum]|uniref:LuxR family transcriptional regulator n=1 Tax=Pedobacter puniceum TaxID=2666136 RepID=A0A7K0FMS0_9SPHI|nr:helix-turn-helix transcriptional regulator [Pedobacter puniceum]MRX46961.1 LuxR family transcriptional regulator [Pedobacter puniceum]
MRAFGTEMHMVTFVFIVLETIMFLHQLQYYLYRPQDKQRSWFLILLFLLIVYNITGGFFPDPNIPIPIVLQNILAYAGGFAVASYVPYYFYKGFELNEIRFHAIYGVPLFLLLPFFVFFVVFYAINQNLNQAIEYGVVIPFFYSFVILWAIFKAIWKKYRDRKYQSSIIEIIALYCAILPWVSMTIISYYNVNQLTEVIITNGGFIFISILFFTRYISKARKEYELILLAQNTSNTNFDDVYKTYQLTAREAEIVSLIRVGFKYKDIAQKLFISERTVTTHVQNIYLKIGVSSKVELIRKLEQPAVILAITG